MASKRTSEYKINKLILNRHSPRTMSGEEIEDKQLFSLFEAARFAPSAYNNQPWKFLYAKRNTPNWDLFFNHLVDFNKSWVKNASALVILISNKAPGGYASPTNQFDAGAAWENLALEASNQKLVAHGMIGFDFAKVRETLNIPEDYDILAMIAIGKPGKKSELTKELRQKEIISDRKKLSEIIVEGKFK